MASNIINTSFNGTCVDVNYPCITGARYIDPCDCSFYYLCRDFSSIIRQPCAPGTAYDHTQQNSYCNGIKDVVFSGICSQTKPWERCADDHPTADLDNLKRFCTGSGYFTPPPPPKEKDDGGNTGAIIGVVITLLLIIAIVVLVVIYVRKKGNPITHIKQSKFWQRTVRGRTPRYDDDNSHQSTPRYNDTAGAQGGDEDDETYTELDDTAAYNGSVSARKSPLKNLKSGDSNAHSNQTYDRDTARDMEEGVTYDNPALERDDSPPPDTEMHPAPPAYTSLDEKDQQTPRSYSSLSEHHRARELNEMDHDDMEGVRPTLGDDGYLMADSISQSQGATAPYYELEKEEHEHTSDNSFVA